MYRAFSIILLACSLAVFTSAGCEPIDVDQEPYAPLENEEATGEGDAANKPGVKVDVGDGVDVKVGEKVDVDVDENGVNVDVDPDKKSEPNEAAAAPDNNGAGAAAK